MPENVAARQPGTPLFIALVLITLVGPLSIHLFLPALPHVRRTFAVEEGIAQLAFSLAVVSMACATLAYGSLSDRLGRLPALLGGLAVFCAGAAMAAVAPDINFLLAGRVLQGIGAACGLVLARAIVRDVYGTDRLGQMIAYLTTAYVVGPLFAPPIGGVLTDWLGWQSSLILPAVFGVIAVVVSMVVIGETHRPESGPRPGLVSGYWRLLSAPRFMLYALNPAFATGGFFTHATASSYLMSEVLHRPATEFGLLFMIGPAGYMLGSFLSGRFVGRVSGDFLVVFGSVLSAIGPVVLISQVWGGGLTPLGLFVPAGFLTIGQGLAMPQAQAAAIASEPLLTGTASGIVVFLQFLFGAVLSQIVAMLSDGTAVPMTVAVTGASLLTLICGVGAVMLTRRPAAS